MTNSEAPPNLSVVIPLFNEVESILQLAEELEQALSDLPQTWEVIFVDDGSSDGTFE
ncbi:MAG: glycosyltransferase, partial [Thermoanaerobaculia bacterium]